MLLSKRIFFMGVFFCMFVPEVLAKQTSHISIMTFNIENGGAQVDFNKVVEAVKKSNADVVGIQEAWGSTARLAKALGWHYYDLHHHIISRFPLLYETNTKNKYIYIEVKPKQFIAMANVHLPDEPYGPELVKKGATTAQVEQNEREVRLPTALPVINALAQLAKQHVPVFLTGDFNSPSHLDWTKQTVNVLTNHHYVVNWPVAKIAVSNGFVDSYRVIHANPVLSSGFTWPAGRPQVKNTMDNFNPSSDDLADRVDFIYVSNATVVESHLVGEPHYKDVSISVSPWPSDHRAVVSRFELTPMTVTKKLFPIINRSSGIPSLRVEKSILHVGEPFTIQWKNAPGNGYDFIGIYPVDSIKQWRDPVRLYTDGELNGTVRYDASNVHGNWPVWNKVAEATWPLSKGVYNVKLIADDGVKVLASTKINVVE